MAKKRTPKTNVQETDDTTPIVDPLIKDIIDTTSEDIVSDDTELGDANIDVKGEDEELEIDNTEDTNETNVIPEKEKIVELSKEDDDTTKSISDKERVVVDLLQSAIDGDNTSLRNLANILNDYNDDMKLKKFDRQTVSRHYSFYYTVKGILNKNGDDLVKHLNLLCFAFDKYKDEGFKPVKLFRFNDDWKWGVSSLDACNLLMMVFSTLSNVTTRKEQLNTVDFNSVHELKDLDSDQVSGLENYFKG